MMGAVLAERAVRVNMFAHGRQQSAIRVRDATIS
jgi:hypothetical protein